MTAAALEEIARPAGDVIEDVTANSLADDDDERLLADSLLDVLLFLEEDDVCRRRSRIGEEEC